MSEVIERRENCGCVEAFIWDHIAPSWGDFGGINKLSRTELITLHAMIDQQLLEMLYSKVEEV